MDEGIGVLCSAASQTDRRSDTAGEIGAVASRAQLVIDITAGCRGVDSRLAGGQREEERHGQESAHRAMLGRADTIRDMTELAPAVPSVSSDEMREIDRVMMEDLGIGLEQMMENAGRSLAELAIRRFSPDSVTVLAGKGGNGGGGLACARHLANRGVEVSVCLVTEDMAGVPGRQLLTIRAMGIPILESPTVEGLVIDALVGYSLAGPPQGRVADLIRSVEGRAVLALDVPSGVDPDSGEAYRPAIAAAATLTLALPKSGMVGSPNVGDLYLADISVPASVYSSFGVDSRRIFAMAQVVRISAVNREI